MFGTVIDDVLPVLSLIRSQTDPISKGSHLADNCPYDGPVRVVFYLDLCTPG